MLARAPCDLLWPVGKTRLFDELARQARSDGAIVLAARCHDDEAGVPYGPVVELLRSALQRSDGSWAQEVAPQTLADAALLLPELATLPSAVTFLGRLDGSLDACPRPNTGLERVMNSRETSNAGRVAGREGSDKQGVPA